MQGAPKFEGKNPEIKKPEALKETYKIIHQLEQTAINIEASRLCKELEDEFFGKDGVKSVFESEMKDVYEALLEVCPLDKSK